MEHQVEGSDSVVYHDLMQLARCADLTEIMKCNCIGIGHNREDEPCVFVIPELGLRMQSATYTAKAILEDMLLLFFRVTQNIVESPYSIVYAHSIFSLYTQVTMLRHLYKMLPRRYKKNLNNLYIIHPTARVYAFFHMSRLLLGAHVSRIVKFVPSIFEFQLSIPPTFLKLPASYLQWEDNLQGYSHTDNTPSLIELFDDCLGAPVFVARCIEYLRRNGLHREGIFRVAGDQITLDVGRHRFHQGCQNVIVGGDDAGEALLPEASASSYGVVGDSPRQLRASVARQAYLLVEDVDEVAQLLKAFLRELPEPVVTTMAYHAIVDAVSLQKTEGAEGDAGGLVDLIETVLEEKMPREHFITFDSLLRFLADVAAAGHINKMGPDNISVIFAPTLMRVEMDDPMKAMSDIKICQRILRGLLLKRMERDMTFSMSDRRFGVAIR